MAKRVKGELLGHPLGLYTLFFTELWERFSFYGMKTLLLLYMLNHFFWSQEKASSLLGTYAALAYGLPIVGGFIADRWLGARRAIILGALLLSAGHLCMAIETMTFFYISLGLIIAGVALLKPNVSTQVGSLYKPGDPRRDGGFTIFYMGINVGALAGPLLCDWLRVNYGYAYGFGAAGVGMILGLIVYVIGQRMLVEFDQDATADEGEEGASAAATVPEHPPHVIRDRVFVLLVIFAFVILFWTAFEQSPNAMLVWADKHTNLNLASTEPPPITLDEFVADDAEIGWGEFFTNWWAEPTMTSGQTQSFNPFFIITLAPVFAFFWIWLHRRGLQPSTPTKMVLGLVGVAAAFGIMLPAALSEAGASSVPLAALPDGIAVDGEGFVYSTDAENDGGRVYYGAKRMRYDSATQTLHLNGVLPDLDRLRLLAGAAPTELVAELEEFADRTGDAGLKDEAVTAPLEHFPEGLGSIEIRQGDGAARKTVITWDPETKAVTALDEVKDRARTEFLAAAADPQFKAAVDRIYLDSADFRVTVWWLIAFYLVLTMGELCLSPVGLSLVTKLAPAKHVGLFMGGWFLATAIAEKLAQVFGAYWGKMPPSQYFLIFVVMCAIGALLLAVLVPALKRRMHGVL